MKIIDQSNPSTVKETIAVLRNDGIIVYPTDTLYGFGADATNDAAIEKLNHIKGRSGPRSVIAADLEMVLTWLNITPEKIDIILPYLGGPTTVIVPVKPDIVSRKLLGVNHSLGIRIPNNRFCNELSQQFGKPIISTSVNLTGEKPINDPRLIETNFHSDVDLLIDAGTLPASKGSTIYQFINNELIIIRK